MIAMHHRAKDRLVEAPHKLAGIRTLFGDRLAEQRFEFRPAALLACGSRSNPAEMLHQRIHHEVAERAHFVAVELQFCGFHFANLPRPCRG